MVAANQCRRFGQLHAKSRVFFLMAPKGITWICEELKKKIMEKIY